jgi:hypothetical protein
VPTRDIVRFRPSRYGFRFRNSWPKQPALVLRLGPLRIPIGDASRGLCGGMAYAARDRFERDEEAPPDPTPPRPGMPLFREIVDRQLASFGRLLLSVPIRFWLAAARGERRLVRETVQRAWPAIRAEIDAGRPAMVGLVRLATWNPLAPLGHQVVGFRYDETPDRVVIGVYDPNHPANDDVEIVLERSATDGARLRQSTGEDLIGLLALPFEPARA